MSLGLEDVRKIAKLARLRLSTDEEALYREQMGKILDSVAELSRLDTANVPPTTSVSGAAGAWRDDRAVVFAGAEKILSLAPEREGPYFKVKKVIEG
ncbi:MAG: Asp-tRNA(Asn)/Glu-tRNA(Gln) amidotransferase subunit GatC [Elusimicrobia bacterium]|nr:Asp-tRNA(Asn)/Glu-tRNA(Gln) amidotransferase subunit GatC [Elusimicrobiota bacterium]MDE2314424.1 Asp-tRNA(Asn)/Glu-tRNA(Gln) amidotransferase subunit GatC [Elusimicrobiota bacterium]